MHGSAKEQPFAQREFYVAIPDASVTQHSGDNPDAQQGFCAVWSPHLQLQAVNLSSLAGSLGEPGMILSGDHRDYWKKKILHHNA